MKDALSSEGSAIIEFYNLQNSDVEKISLKTEGENLVSDIELKDGKPPCKHCGSVKIRIKEKPVKLIRHTTAAGRPCLIRYHAHRYTCLTCGRTFFEDNPFVFKAQKISVLTVTNILDDLKNPAETFSNVARRYKLSPTTVASIFDEHVAMNRLPLPEYIAIDESYSFHSEVSKYVCMFIDFLTGEPIDILPSRKEDDLLEYFRRIPLEERRNVKLVGMDMWKTYRKVVKEVFPRAYCVADFYHIKADMHRKIDRIRIRVMKRYDKKSEEYHLLKHFNWLLFKNTDAKDKDGNLLLDPKRPGKLNHKFNKELNFYDLLELIRCIDPELTEAIDLKNKCNDFYKNNTYDTCENALKQLIKDFRAASTEDMRAFGDTLAEWRHEIVNSFIVIGHEYSVDHRDGHVESLKIRIRSAGILSAGYFYPHLFYFGR